MKTQKTSDTGRGKWPIRVIQITVIFLAGVICAWLIAVKTGWHMLNDLFYQAGMMAHIWVIVFIAGLLLITALAVILLMLLRRRTALRDVHEEYRGHGELQKSELKYRMLFENMNAGFALHEMIYNKEGKPVDYRFLEINPMFEKLTGIKAEQCLGRTVMEVLPDAEAYWIETYGKVVQTGEPVYFQNYVQQMDKYFDIYAFSPQKGQFAVFLVDITERVHAEDELKKFFTVNLDLLCIADIDGNFIKTNEAWGRTLGYSTSDLNNMKFLDFVHPDDIQSTLKAMSQLGKGEEVLNFINRYRCKDGSYRFIEWRSYPSGKLIYAAARDITDHKRTEEVLRENEARLRAITDSAQDAIIMMAPHGRISFWNPASEKILGYTADEAIGQDLHELIVPERFLDAHRAAYPEFLKTGRGNAIGKTLELSARRKDGQEISVSLSLSAVSIHGEWHAVGMLRDITDSKRAEMLLKIRFTLLEFARNHSVEELLQKALDEVGAFTDSPIGFYHFVEKDQKTLSLQAWSTSTMKEFCKAQGKGMHYSIDQAGVWVDCVRERRPVIHNDYNSLPHRKGLPEGHAPVIRELVVPVIRGENVVAILGIGNKPVDYTEKDLEMVNYLADVAWVIINWKQLDEALRESEAGLKEAHNIAKMGRWDFYHAENKLKWTEYITRIFEISSEKIEKSYGAFLAIIHPEDRQMVDKAWKQSLIDRKPYSIEHRLLMPDGRVKWVFLHCRTEFDENSRPVRSTGVVQEITEHKQDEMQILQDRWRLDTILRGTNVGTWEWNVVTGETVFNERWAEIIGYTLEELSPVNINTWMRFAHPDDLKLSGELLEKHFAGELAYYECESRMHHKNGEWVWVLDRGRVATWTEDGKPLLMMGTHQDITGRKRAEEVLRQAKEEAESANRSKSEFLANMSHEIRTPMNAVISLSRLMEDTPLNAAQHDYLNKIKGSSHMLLGIINDILDFSKIEAGKLELEHKPFALKDLLDQLKTLFVSTAHDKGIELVLDADPDLPREVVGDSLRLGQVLANLMGNAVKFTPSGHVMLKIYSADSRTMIQDSRFKIQDSKPKGNKDQDSCRLCFSVEDSGIGISEELLLKLFQPFSQADTSTTRKYGGTGLGLVISRRIVELMGGKLEVSSVSGKGSRFFFEIEMPVASMNKGVADRPQMIADGISFLVVDDQKTARLALRHIIESWHGSVDEASGGVEAVDMVLEAYKRGKPYDYILMDLKMPGEIDGLSAVRRIEELHQRGVIKEQKAPVFIISAYNRNDLPDNEVNYSAFLNKPVTASDLYNAIMEVSGKEKKAYAQINKAVSTPSFKGYTILLVEDNDLNRLVATKFLEKTGADIITANNGLEAIDVFENKPVDLILMDLQMPEMDGFEATKRIRKMEQETGIREKSSISPGSVSRTPIIALTAAVMEGDRDRAASAGVDRHLGKPIDEQELYKVMGDFLESKADAGAQDSRAAESKEPFPIMDDFDLKQGKSASQGNPAFYRKLLRGFDNQLSGQFLNMADDMQNLEVSEIQQIAHTLKGIAGTVGAIRIAVIAEKIDKICKSGARPSGDLAQNLGQAIVSAREQIGIHVNKPELNIQGAVDDREGIEALNELHILLHNSELAGDNLINKAVRYVADSVNKEAADELLKHVESFDMDGAEKLVARILEEIKNG